MRHVRYTGGTLHVSIYVHKLFFQNYVYNTGVYFLVLAEGYIIKKLLT